MRLLPTSGEAVEPPLTHGVDAVILFADVDGFTSMAEALSGAGSYGTEQLTRIINDWFALTADAIARHGGTVVDFAGDALVGLFEYDSGSGPLVARSAVRCAHLIRSATASVAPVPTPEGSRALTMRVGLAGGPVQMMLLGDPAIRLQHLVAGPALDQAVDALRHARQGEIVVARGLRNMAGLAAGEDRDGWHVVTGLAAGTAQAPGPASAATPVADDPERLLTPFLHPEIRARLRSGRQELVNEHRKVTTAFVRLPDLSVDDPRTVGALQRYLAAGVAVIDRYRGHLRHLMADDKGTVLVAVFGTPVSHEDDEERAIRCCLELLALPGGPYRAGATTGPVYCGEVGSDVRREYAVVGDAVNLAARLMQEAAAGQLLVDQATYDRVRDEVVADGPSAVTVKGKALPVPVWAVRAIREPASTGPVSTVEMTPLVGRDAELGRIRTIAAQVRSGRGHVLWLRGEAGIGKSRLAAEIGGLVQAAGFAWYAGSCRSHGTTTGYLVWRSIWRALLEVDPTLSIPAQRSALTDRIARYDGSGQRAPVLAPVVNLPMPDTELTAQLDPAGRDELLRSTLLACLLDRVADAPVMLLLEDCHWIDPASLALLDFLARHIVDLPVLVVATSREPVAGRLARLDHLIDVLLTELRDLDAERLATLRLQERYGSGTAVANALVRKTVERAGGNPFYIEELVSYLHGHGVDPGGPHALTVQLPDNLQRLVMARIDQLTDDEKATIKVASVIGRRFQPPWITAVYPAAGAVQQIVHQLRRLDALDLTPQVAADPQAEYEFKHPITQEVAYQSITHDTRAALHERIGQVIETTYADRLPQYVDVLAHHWSRTGRTDKQRIWFRAAGDGAVAMFANDAAIDYYGRLLPLVSDAERAELHVDIGSVYHHMGRWPQAEDHYRRAMRAAETTGRRDILAASQRQLGDLLMYTDSYAESVIWLKRATVEFERLGDRHGLSRTLDRMTFALFRQGAYDEALAMARRQSTMAQERDDLPGLSTALNHIGLVNVNTGHQEEALDHLRRAVDTAERAGDKHCALHAASNLAWAYLRGADHVQAIASYRQALAVARDIGAGHTANVIVGNLGEIYRELGDADRARTCAMHSLRVAIDIGDWSTVADQVANLGAIDAAEDRADRAERLLGRAVELARDLDAPYFLCDWLHRLARLHMAAGRLSDAEELNTEALDIADEHSERDIQVSAYLLSVRLRVATARIDARTATGQLRESVGDWTEQHEVAALLDTVWELDRQDEDARTAAAEIYRRLYERAPTIEYRDAYRRLTGIRLPPQPPLPPLPEWIAPADDVDLELLLRRVDRTAHDLETN